MLGKLWSMYSGQLIGGLLGAYCGFYIAVHQVAAVMTGRVIMAEYNPQHESTFPFTIFSQPDSWAGFLGSFALIWPLMIVFMILVLRTFAKSESNPKVVDAVQIGCGIGWATIALPLHVLSN